MRFFEHNTVHNQERRVGVGKIETGEEGPLAKHFRNDKKKQKTVTERLSLHFDAGRLGLVLFFCLLTCVWSARMTLGRTSEDRFGDLGNYRSSLLTDDPLWLCNGIQ